VGGGGEVTEAQAEIKIRDSANRRETTSFLQFLARHGSLSFPLALKPVSAVSILFLFLKATLLLPGQ
jgi:hypothetical protein